MAVAVSRPAPWKNVKRPAYDPHTLFGQTVIIVWAMAENTIGPVIDVKYFRERKNGRDWIAVVSGTNAMRTKAADAIILALQPLESVVK